MFINKVFILFLLLILFGFSFSVSAQKDNLFKKIYAYYPLAGDTIDQGPHQLHGEEVDKKRGTENRSGKKNGALSFRGEADLITLPVNINSKKMPQLTIALWLKLEESSGIRKIISNSNNDSYDRSLIIDGRKKRPLLSIFTGSKQQFYGGISIPQNKWFFTAVSWNAEQEKVTLYLIDQNRNISVISTNNINPDEGENFIQLGGNYEGGDFFIGSMSQLMIWDQILSKAEIKSLAF